MWANTTIGVLCLQPLHVVLEPIELLAPSDAKAASLQIHHVDQADEVHAFLIEAVPAFALGSFAVSLEVVAPSSSITSCSPGT